MFGIGGTELFLILLFAFLIFGPDKLPGMGRTIGRALRQFKQAQEGFTQVVQTEVLDPAAEAMNASAGKPNRKRAEELDEDADLELAEGEDAPAPRRTETFAERKKRLAAEKLAREAEAAEAAAETVPSTNSDDDDADIAEGAPAQPAPEGADEPAAKTAAPSKPSATDLYSMRRPSRPSASAGSVETSLDASREASEARSAERRAVEGSIDASGATPDNEKEA